MSQRATRYSAIVCHAGLAVSRDGSDLFAPDLHAKRCGGITIGSEASDGRLRPAGESWGWPALATVGCSPAMAKTSTGCDGELIAKLDSTAAADAVSCSPPRAGVDGRARSKVFDADDGRLLKSITGPWKITAATFSPDRRRPCGPAWKPGRLSGGNGNNANAIDSRRKAKPEPIMTSRAGHFRPVSCGIKCGSQAGLTVEAPLSSPVP